MSHSLIRFEDGSAICSCGGYVSKPEDKNRSKGWAAHLAEVNRRRREG